MQLEAAMIEYGAPTLAGLKPASLFRYSPANRRVFGLQLMSWQKQLAPFGIRLAVLKGCPKTGSYLLYLYRWAELSRLTRQPAIQAFLTKMGYTPWTDFSDLLRQLARRMCLQESFPHEIGIFLGYPLEDVEGFIRNKGKRYTCCGCWKSYGNPQIASRQFAAYRKCTNILRARYAGGTPVLRLIVAA